MVEENIAYTLNGQRAQVSAILRPLNTAVIVSDEAVLRLEHQSFFHTADKVAIIFLAHDDLKLAYNQMTELLTTKQADIFRSIRDNAENWKIKVLESLSLMKHYRGIRYVGLDKSDVLLNSKDKSVKLSDRGSMYSICEQLNAEETKAFIEEMEQSGFPCMKGVPCINDQTLYLEHYILHWIVSGQKKEAILPSIAKFLVKIEKQHLMEDSCSFGTALPFNPIIVQPPRIQYSPEEAYPIINKQKVGLCIVINESDYSESRVRKGSEKDVASIESTMREMKFKVVTRMNVGGRQMLDEIKSMIQKYFSETHSILMIVAMAHGEEDMIKGVDEVAINIQKIADITAHFKILDHKPKILVVQACQGDEYFKCLEPDGTTTHGPNHPGRITGIKSATDIVVCMSTIRGFVTYRDTLKGSLFIQRLCRVIEENPHQEFTKILQLVNRGFVTSCLGRGLGLQPEFKSRLTKDLYLSLPPNTNSAEESAA